ncbi:hypothetical protein EPUL_005634, partial [Erysiphe pulchra]
ILFETFNVPALYTSIQAVLSLYASGRTTGIVLDAGDGVSHAVPVYEGFAIPNSIRRIDIAGRDVTEHLQTLLRKEGRVFHTSAEKEVVKQIKEKTSYIALDPKKEEKDWMVAVGRNGNTRVTDSRSAVSASGRLRSCSTRKSSAPSGLAFTRLSSTLSTGQTWTSARLSSATLFSLVQRLAVKDMRIKIFAPPERLYSTWIGGSILAGLSTFRKMYVTVDDWH